MRKWNVNQTITNDQFQLLLNPAQSQLSLLKHDARDVNTPSHDTSTNVVLLSLELSENSITLSQTGRLHMVDYLMLVVVPVDVLANM
jgi:hypothetical protein